MSAERVAEILGSIERRLRAGESVDYDLEGKALVIAQSISDANYVAAIGQRWDETSKWLAESNARFAERLEELYGDRPQGPAPLASGGG